MSSQQLTTGLKIGDVLFTPREIDILSCLSNGRTGKKEIADLLDISDNTVIAHLRNMIKKCNFPNWQSLRDFIIISKCEYDLRAHYIFLQNDYQCRKAFSRLPLHLKPKKIECFIMQSNDTTPFPLLEKFKYDLKYCGIDLSIKDAPLNDPTLEAAKNITEDNKIIMVPYNNRFAQELKTIDKINIKPDEKILNQLFLVLVESVPEDNLFNNEGWNLHHIDIKNINVYHLSLINFLSSIVKGLDKTIETELIRLKSNINQYDFRFHFISEINDEKLDSFPNSITLLTVSKRKLIIVSSLAIVCCFFLIPVKNIYKEQLRGLFEKQIVARSDLIIPVESFLLHRDQLMGQIKQKLQTNDDVRKVVLVGTGGAGKTVLARQYANEEKRSIVWEINAETKNTMLNSYENLALSLCKSKEQNEELLDIKQTQIPEEKERKLFSLLKNQLKENSNWLIIFDNLNDFSLLNRYLPANAAVWGRGSIIITVRDPHIQSSEFVEQNDIIHIDMLLPQEALALFSKIYFSCEPDKLTQEQIKSSLNLLENIPPFPLDISITARYLKNCVFGFDDYINFIRNHKNEAVEQHEQILKKFGDYRKTRQSIIHFCLDEIIKINPEFSDMFIFLSVLNSQEIPVELLNGYKDPQIASQFLYELNKHCLISADDKNISEGIKNFSFHREVHSIIRSDIFARYKKENLTQNLSKAVTLYIEYLKKQFANYDARKQRNAINHSDYFIDNKYLFDKKNISDLYIHLGNCYKFLGNYQLANEYIGMGVDFFRRNGPAEKLVEGLGYLGSLYSYLGEYLQAEKILKESLSLRVDLTPQNELIIGLNSVYLAIIEWEIGNYELAMSLLEKAEHIFEKQSEHTRLAWVFGNKALVHKDLEHFQLAILLCEKAKKIYHKLDNKRGSAWIDIITGLIYIDQHNLDKAEASLTKAYTYYEETLGKKNVATAHIIGQLGLINVLKHNYKLGYEQILTNIKMFSQLYGENHSRTSEVLLNLIILLLEKKEYKKAQDIINKVKNNFLPTQRKQINKLSDLQKKAQTK